MDHKHTRDVPTHGTDEVGFPDNHPRKPSSKVTAPILIEIGTEDSKFLESKVNEKTNETVKANDHWTCFRGRHTRTIDTSVVAGFMFQKDLGTGMITMSENGNWPIETLINSEQGFAMCLVVVLPHEKWTISGKFCLRFVLRVPISGKKETARMNVTVAGTFARHVATPSAPRKRSIDELGSATVDATDTKKQRKQRTADWVASTSNVVPPQTLPHVALTERGNMVPLPHRPGDSEYGDTEYGDTTDEEDCYTIGAAALRERYGRGVSVDHDGDTTNEEDHRAIAAAALRDGDEGGVSIHQDGDATNEENGRGIAAAALRDGDEGGVSIHQDEDVTNEEDHSAIGAAA